MQLSKATISTPTKTAPTTTIPTPTTAQYLIQGEQRIRVLRSLSQPLTARQLARRTGLTFDVCRDIVRELAIHKLIYCLNDRARRSRLYWPTDLGMGYLQHLSQTDVVPLPNHPLACTDWERYGWVCFSHRAAIIKTLTEPMQPALIKRRARFRYPDLRMSSNNVRDVIRLFVEKGIVQTVQVPKKAHTHYQLTEMGQLFQRLLQRAEVPL